MIKLAGLIIMLLFCFGMLDAYGQTGIGSQFDKKYSDTKFLDAYFGTLNEKIQVTPGDRNVPLTIVFSNVGTIDITGIKGKLSMTSQFSPSGTMDFVADQQSNAVAGQIFSLTFFIDVSNTTMLQSYPAAINLEYLRVRESGNRLVMIPFEFQVPGKVSLQASTPIHFLTSLEQNEITIQITNTGTGVASDVDVEFQNTQFSSVAMQDVKNIVITDTYWDLGHIEPNSSAEFSTSIYVPVSIKDQTFRSTLFISYIDTQGNRKNITRVVDFYIGGKLDISIYAVKLIELSNKKTLIGEIINEGNENALFGFVTLNALGDSTIINSTQFIDEIEIDSPTPFNIPLEFNGSYQPGLHDVSIVVRYKDAMRTELFTTYNTTINLEPQLDQTESDIPYEIILAGVIIGIIAPIVLIKKRKSS